MGVMGIKITPGNMTEILRSMPVNRRGEFVSQWRSVRGPEREMYYIMPTKYLVQKLEFDYKILPLSEMASEYRFELPKEDNVWFSARPHAPSGNGGETSSEWKHLERWCGFR